MQMHLKLLILSFSNSYWEAVKVNIVLLIVYRTDIIGASGATSCRVIELFPWKTMLKAFFPWTFWLASDSVAFACSFGEGWMTSEQIYTLAGVCFGCGFGQLTLVKQEWILIFLQSVFCLKGIDNMLLVVSNVSSAKEGWWQQLQIIRRKKTPV